MSTRVGVGKCIVKTRIDDYKKINDITSLFTIENQVIINGVLKLNLDEVKPVLRPLADMTEEEFREWVNHRISCAAAIVKTKNNDEYIKATINESIDTIDYLISRYFDIRGLIERGLAIETSINDEQISKLL